MKLSLIPRERRFYELFRRQGMLVSETLTELSNALLEGRNRHSRLRELEHTCDDVTHDIYNLTNLTFTTPIDQGDILLLAHALDQVVDLAEEVSDKIDLYEIVSLLEDFIGIGSVLQEIHRLENEGDSINRVALQKLFETNHQTPADVIKWKDLYSLLESTLDECESAAEIIETIAIKDA